MPQLVAAIGSIGSAFAATGVGHFLTQTVIGKLLSSVALSALQRALMSQPSRRAPGIKTTATQAGGTNPGQFIIGRYATGGYAVAPAMSHGSVSGVPDNAFLTYVIEVSDIPVQGLAGLIIDGTVAEIGTSPHADYGLPILGDFEGRAWVKFYDGAQTVADPMLLAKYGSYPDRPWTSDMIGRGIAYAIMTFQYDREIFSNLPTVRFIVDGIKLYDPRKDTTAGGSGAHRWNNPATWKFSQNPAVQIYNIMRGITLPDGNVWGGRFSAADLPFSNWVAAMNACDVPVTEGGATVATFRTGLEVSVGDEPAGVIEELLSGCLGQMVDMGGTWKIRVGGPGLPVLFYTDDDVMVTRPEDFDPFPSVTATYNGITATYPAPGALWEPKEAAPIYRTDWEAEDDQRLVAALQFACVTSHRQARHIMRSTLRDHRRMRRHNNTLGPFAMGLEPLDVVAWTSARNGYTEKSFEVGQVVDDLGGLPVVQVALREVDGSDYDPDEFDDTSISLPPGKVIRPAPRQVMGFSVTPYTIDDDEAKPRRPALLLTWNTDAVDDVDGIEWEVRFNGTTVTASEGVIRNVAAGRKVVTGGIINGKVYQARARLVTNRKRSWTGWVTVTAPDVRIEGDDLGDEVTTGEGDNIFKDFDMVRPALWTTPGSVSDYGFTEASAPKLGRRYLRIFDSEFERNVYSKWFRVDPEAEYRADGACWITGGTGTAEIYMQTASMNSAGVVNEAGLNQTLIKARTDTTYSSATAHGSINVSPRSTDRVARFRVRRAAGGTGDLGAGGFKLRRRLKTPFIGSKQITTEAINDNAVTMPVYVAASRTVPIPASLSYTTVIGATINRDADYDTRISASFLLGPPSGATVGDVMQFQFGLSKDGGAVSAVYEALVPVTSGFNPRTGTMMSFVAWDTEKAGGSTTYEVKIRGKSLSHSGYITTRTIEVEQRYR